MKRICQLLTVLSILVLFSFTKVRSNPLSLVNVKSNVPLCFGESLSLELYLENVTFPCNIIYTTDQGFSKDTIKNITSTPYLFSASPSSTTTFQFLSLKNQNETKYTPFFPDVTTRVAVHNYQTGPGNVLYVNKHNSNDGNGSGWNNAIQELADALYFAKKCGSGSVTEIWVASNTYYPLYPIADEDVGANPASERDRTFLLPANVKIYGGFAGTESSSTQRRWKSRITILSGDIGFDSDYSDNCYHVVTALGNLGTTCLDGFTIQEGNADGSSTLIADGIKVDQYNGGGIHNQSKGVRFENLIIHLNIATSGGGLYFSNASSIINKTRIEDNYATTSGGGMYTISGNSVIANALFVRNLSDYSGGAFVADGSKDSLINVTMTENSASTLGSAFSCIAGSHSKFKNAIIWGNDNGNQIEINSSDLYYWNSLVENKNLVGINDCLDGTDSEYDPKIDPENYSLLPESPVINKGNIDLYNLSILGDKDINNNTRITDNQIDLGAFEFFLPKEPFFCVGSKLSEIEVIIDDESGIIPGSGRWTLNALAIDTSSRILTLADHEGILIYEVETYCNGTVISNPITLKVGDKPEITAFDHKLAFCIGDSLLANISVNNNNLPITSWEWKLGSEIINAGDTSELHFRPLTIADNGKTITITIMNACGSDTQYFTLDVSNKPELSFPDHFTCYNALSNLVTITTNASTTGLANILYYTDEECTIPVSSPLSVSTGKYYIVGISNGGCTDTAAINIKNSDITVSISGPTTVCANQTITYTGNGTTGNYDYVWDIGDGTMVSGNGTNEIQVFWTTAGNKSITLQFKNEDHCTGTSRIYLVTINPRPNFQFKDTIVYVPNKANLNNLKLISGSISGLVLSYFSDANCTTPISDPTSVGAGIYYIIGENNDRCSDTVIVKVIELAKPQIILMDSCSLQPRLTLDYELYEDGLQPRYEWMILDNEQITWVSIPGATTLTHYPNLDGIYKVQITFPSGVILYTDQIKYIVIQSRILPGGIVWFESKLE